MNQVVICAFRIAAALLAIIAVRCEVHYDTVTNTNYAIMSMLLAGCAAVVWTLSGYLK